MMAITTETDIDELLVDGRRIRVVRVTWPANRGGGAAYDLYDADTGDCLTEDESFDTEPSLDQVRNAILEFGYQHTRIGAVLRRGLRAADRFPGIVAHDLQAGGTAIFGDALVVTGAGLDVSYYDGVWAVADRHGGTFRHASLWWALYEATVDSLEGPCQR
jgi:hypothetical protein